MSTQENNNWTQVDLRGHGGREQEMARLFPQLQRQSGPLHDFVDPVSGQLYEIKKTANRRLQAWIDPTKYIDLSPADRDIVFRFVRFDPATGHCVECVDTTLGEVVDRFVPESVLGPARLMVGLYPKRSQFQFKLNILWRS